MDADKNLEQVKHRSRLHRRNPGGFTALDMYNSTKSTCSYRLEPHAHSRLLEVELERSDIRGTTKKHCKNDGIKELRLLTKVGCSNISGASKI